MILLHGSATKLANTNQIENTGSDNCRDSEVDENKQLFLVIVNQRFYSRYIYNFYSKTSVISHFTNRLN